VLVGVTASSSSSRVDIAPRRRRRLHAADRKTFDARRPHRSTLIGSDLLDITDRARDGAAMRRRRGRAAKSNQRSRACDGAVISSARDVGLFPPCLAGRPGLRRHHDRVGNARSRRQSAQATLTFIVALRSPQRSDCCFSLPALAPPQPTTR